MKKQTKRLLIFLTLLSLQANVHAAENSYTLPLTLAVEAVNETVRSCEALGYNVSVAFVDMSGQPRVQLKSDKSTPHTFETAYRKAYAIVTFGPNYRLETSGQVADLMSKNPAIYNAVLTIPNVTPLPGALAIKVKGNMIGAIGVSGAPGGDKDEACAQTGIDKISSRLPE